MGHHEMLRCVLALAMLEFAEQHHRGLFASSLARSVTVMLLDVQGEVFSWDESDMPHRAAALLPSVSSLA